MNVMVASPGTNTLDVSWTNGNNGNSPITGVTIAFSARGDSSRSQNFSGDASLQSATLMNLMPFRTYTISVFVVNAIGRSEPGNVNGTTLSLRKSPPPCCYSNRSLAPLVHSFILLCISIVLLEALCLRTSIKGGAVYRYAIPGASIYSHNLSSHLIIRG